MSTRSKQKRKFGQNGRLNVRYIAPNQKSVNAFLERIVFTTALINSNKIRSAKNYSGYGFY